MQANERNGHLLHSTHFEADTECLHLRGGGGATPKADEEAEEGEEGAFDFYLQRL